MEAPFGLCSICGGDNLQAGDDGFFYCSLCGSQSQQFQEQALDAVENQFIGAIRRAQRHTATNHISPMASIFGTQENVFPSQEGLSTQPFSQFDGTQSVYGAVEGTFSQLGSQFANMDEIPNRWDSGGGWQYESRGGVQQPLEPEKARYMLANSIRQCYCEGLQKILQFQCEALVQKFGVSPLICGIVGPIWLRYLAVSHVFEGEWAKEAIEVEEAKEDHRRNKRMRNKGEESQTLPDTQSKQDNRKKSSSEPRTSNGTKARFVWLAALKERIPVALTLAFLFLACHIAREPVLPTDIVNWTLEGTLPYLAAFHDITKQRAGRSPPLPMDAKLMFKPMNAMSAKKLEFMAGTIASRIGLKLPPVNFHALSCRLLRQLKLPVEKLSVYVCRFFDWYTPSGLWLSDQIHALPSRVYVMAMVMIVLRILYRIDGQGYWEKSVTCGQKSNEGNFPTACIMPEEHRMVEGRMRDFGPSLIPHEVTEETASDTDAGINKKIYPQLHKSGVKEGIEKKSLLDSKEFNLEEVNSWDGPSILEELDMYWHDEKFQRFDYEADLPTYLKYCRDVIFSGMTMQTDEENLCNDLWRLYEKLQKKESGDEEDGKDTLEMKDVKSLEINDVNEPALRLNEPSSSRISESSNLSFVPSRQGIRNSKQNCTAIKITSVLEGSTYRTYGEERELEEERLNSPENTEKVQRHRVLEETLQDMEEFGFKYIPPLRKSPPPNAFLRYVRGESKGSGPQRYMHADYFVLLRACAKAINVEPKALYWCSYRVENGLKWIEDKVKELIESKVLNMEESGGI